MPLKTIQDERNERLRAWIAAVKPGNTGMVSIGIIAAVLVVGLYAPWIGALLLGVFCLGFVAASLLK